VTTLLLCPPEPLLSASMRRTVTPGGTTYSWTSHGTVVIGPSSKTCRSLNHPASVLPGGRSIWSGTQRLKRLPLRVDGSLADPRQEAHLTALTRLAELQQQLEEPDAPESAEAPVHAAPAAATAQPVMAELENDESSPSREPNHTLQLAAPFIRELLSIRQQLQAALARCDRLLVAQPPSASPDDYRTLQARYRVSPGGPLSPEGVAEIRRRFEAGETDFLIAREMAISVQGVAKRRVDFNIVAGAARRRPGALWGRIQMAPDFDELPPEERDAMEGQR
jgi:hypothetical protein